MRNIKSKKLFLLVLVFCIYPANIVYADASLLYDDAIRQADGLIAPDQYTLISKRSFLSGYEALNQDGTVNVVVEIPAGSNAKWEVNKPAGELVWTFKNAKPRVVKYLAYPGNYGMIPKTLLPKDLGGDGDPLDIIILGPTVARGSVVPAKVIGILKLLDKGEQDDKLIAVLANGPLGHISSLQELDKDYVGISKIIELWFENYKGPGKMVSKGFGDKATASKVLNTSIKAYGKSKVL